MKTYAEQLIEINKRLEEGPPNKEGPAMYEYRARLKRKNLIERMMQSLKVGPFKPAKPKKSKVAVPGRPIHVISVPVSQYQDVFLAPPAGHLGVLPLLKVDSMKIGDMIHFTESGEMTMEGVIVAIELPGKKSIRPDLSEKFFGRYKIHWLPWDPTRK